jgi:hypothetical protein
MPAAAQAEHAHRGGAKIQLLAIHAHAPDALTATRTAPQMAASSRSRSQEQHRRKLAKAGR